MGVEILGAIPSPVTGVDTRPATIPYVRESVDGREMALLSGGVVGGAWTRGVDTTSITPLPGTGGEARITENSFM